MAGAVAADIENTVVKHQLAGGDIIGTCAALIADVERRAVGHEAAAIRDRHGSARLGHRSGATEITDLYLASLVPPHTNI